MANSCKPGPFNPPLGCCLIPPRTCGPLGKLDQGDPDVTSLLGDTPGSLGLNDWAAPWQPDSSALFMSHSGAQCRDMDGTALSLGNNPLTPVSAPAVITELNWDDVKADFEKWEGKISHMYLDTKGLVTVGIGKMLPNVTAAKALGFVRRSDGVPATAIEIEADFNEVSKQSKGKIASLYKPLTKLDLPDDKIFALLKEVVAGFEANLEGNFTGYKTYPLAAKRALLDMIYNLGLSGLLKFKNFKTAIEERSWKKASEDCHRSGPSDERNNWTRDMFLEAAKGS